MLCPDPDAVLARVRALALTLPETVERPSHGQPTFFVAGKMFAQFRHDHHGDGRTIVAVKVAVPEEADMLIAADPGHYSRVAYMRTGWIGLALAAADADWGAIEDRIAASWRLAAPARLHERAEP